MKRKHCSIKNSNCIQVWKEYNQELPSSDFDQGRIYLHKACLSLSSYHFFHYECCLSHWSLVFSLLSTNFMHWALWAWIHLPFGLRIQNLPLQIAYIIFITTPFLISLFYYSIFTNTISFSFSPIYFLYNLYLP